MISPIRLIRRKRILIDIDTGKIEIIVNGYDRMKRP